MGNHVLGIATQVLVMAIMISVILLFLGIGILVLIHVCIMGRTLGSRLSEGNINMVESRSFGSTSLSQDDIEKLPCFDFNGTETGSSPPGDCAVCLENFRIGEKCRLLPSCNHSFHAECVDLWLLRAPVCPICRAVADVVRGASLYGEESNRFSESGVDLSDGEGRGSGEIEVRIDGLQDEERGPNSGNVDSSERSFPERHMRSVVDVEVG